MKVYYCGFRILEENVVLYYFILFPYSIFEASIVSYIKLQANCLEEKVKIKCKPHFFR